MVAGGKRLNARLCTDARGSVAIFQGSHPKTFKSGVDGRRREGERGATHATVLFTTTSELH